MTPPFVAPQIDILSFVERIFKQELSLSEALTQIASTPATILELLERATAQMMIAPRWAFVATSLAYGLAINLNHPFWWVESGIKQAQTTLKMGLWDQTLDTCQQIEETLQNLADPLRQAEYDLVQATAYYHLNRYQEAQTVGRQGLIVFEHLAQGTKIAQTNCLLAHILREQEQYQSSLALYQKARTIFYQAEQWPDVACCDQNIAFIYLLQNEYRQAETLLEHAFGVLSAAKWYVDAAYGRRILATLYLDQSRYQEALQILEAAQAVYQTEGILEGIEGCERNIANIYRKIGRFDEALNTYQQLRDRYFQQGASVNVARCDMLIGLTYEEKGYYDEALTVYQQAVATCNREGLVVATARCQLNMAAIYEKKGWYDQAIELLYQAHEVFQARKMHVNVAHCHESLAALYLTINQYPQALESLQQSQQVFAAEAMQFHKTAVQVKMAAIYLEIDKAEVALDLLQQSRLVYDQAVMPVQVALCDLLIGDFWQKTGQSEQALICYQKAYQQFVEQNLPVYQARCALGIATTQLANANYQQASASFAAANQFFGTRLPELAWRVAYGWGQCAVAEGMLQQGWQHYEEAIHFITLSRQQLYTERLSGAYFASRKHVYDKAVFLAAQLQKNEHMVEIIESSKAQTLLSALYNRQLRQQMIQTKGGVVKELLLQEQVLQHQINYLRGQLVAGEDHRLLEGESAQVDLQWEKRWQELTAVLQTHQRLVERLSRLQSGYAAPPFSVAAFRQVISSHLTVRWRCLVYYIADEKLVILYLDDHQILHWDKPFPEYTRQQLSLCVSANKYQREYIYKGAIQGHATPALGETFLSRFYQLLIPPEAITGFAPDDVLLIVPHQMLHALPFHALLASGEPDNYLARQAAVVYAPSLHTWQIQVERLPALAAPQAALVYGATMFGTRAEPLPYVHDEVEILQNMFQEQCQVFLNTELLPDPIHQLNEKAQLKVYRFIHFATHAYFEAGAPMQSHILLHREDLTVSMILNLSLQADLVTLSACDTALQNQFEGDEMVGLVNAFFRAGARTLLVTLWHVADRSTCEFMKQFYRRLLQGATISQALQATQQFMMWAGYTPYEWAPFILIGHPG